MALKHRITVAEFTGLSAGVQAEYKQGAAGFYELDLADKHPDTIALQAQLQTEQQGRVAAEAKVASAELKAETAKANVEKEFNDKLTTAEEKAAKYGDQIVKSAKTAKVTEIASKFKSASLFEAKLEQQIQATLAEDGTVQFKYLDDKGAETDWAKLSKSYLENPEYAVMLATPTKSGTMPAPTPVPNPAPAGQQQQPAGQGPQSTYAGKNTAELKQVFAEKHPELFAATTQ